MKKKVLIVSIIFFMVLVIAGGILYFCLKDVNKDDTQANMEFIINDTLSEGNNKKVKVFLLAGQSNATGVANEQEFKNNLSDEEFKSVGINQSLAEAIKEHLNK